VEERHKELLSDLRQDLDEVEAAMERLDDGTYGRCEGCGSPFSAADLEAQPALRRCLSCG
jgi:DnaK suppressor protein